MFKYTLDNKRYHTLNYFFKTKFGKKVFKVPLDIKSSCPNKKSGGCIFCKDSSVSSISDSSLDIVRQFEKAKSVLEKKWPDSYYIPYFQSGTNTYCNVCDVKPLIDELLKIDGVVGIDIATRCDSINEEWLNYLDDLNKKTFLMVELGLQSSNDETLRLINRGHDKASFTKMTSILKNKNIFVVAHIINGLPYETKEDMINTVKYLNDLGIDGIKIHALYIANDTKLASMYLNDSFHVLSKDEFIDIVCLQLELLNENIVIMRITGDPNKDDLIEPNWLLKKFVVLNDIDKEMKKRDIYQGDLL